MKNLYLFVFLSFAFSTVKAQFAFSTPINQLCIDGETTITGFQNWMAYQTLEDTYDGTIDSTVCINLGSQPWQAELMTSEFDASKPVFLRWHSDDGHLLDPNTLYALSIYLNMMNDLNSGLEDCEDGVCNGFIVRVRVPDSPNDMDDLPEYRLHTQEFVANNFGYISVCLPTESFENGTFIEDIVLKLNVIEEAPSILVYDVFLEYVWSGVILGESDMLDYQNGQFNYTLWSYNNYVIQYEETTFPSVDDISYLDVSPVPNISEQAAIFLTIAQEASLTFQPFTALRAGLIEGQTEDRHILSIVNNGSVCMNFWFELALPPGGTYIHNEGRIESSWGSCMRFVPDAKLRVAADKVLEFGQMGMGMLAMQSQSLIELEENAQIELNCPMRIFNEPWQTEIEHVHVYLKPGNALVFGPYASMENYSTNETMKLMVHMQGGYLDIANLSDEERKHIVLVYDNATPNFDWISQESLVTDDEWNGACRVKGNAALTWEVYNSAGQRVLSSSVSNNQHYVQLSFSTADWSNGMYTLVLMENGQRIATKLMVAHQ
jgi:hypothetical protein